MPAAAARTRTRTTTSVGLAARARAFDAGVFERAVEEVVRLDGATLLRTPSLPLVPHLNTLVVDGALDAAAVEVLADEHGVGRVDVDDEAVAAALERRGWHPDRLALLGRDGSAPPPNAEAPAEEVPYGHVRGLRDDWIRSEPWATSDAVIAHAHAADERLFAGTPTRAFATFEQGRPLAYALLVDGGRDGMLEDVYTRPEARGRGLATSVIAAVLFAARGEGHEVVFVPTAAGGRPQQLYERLGFELLTVRRRFMKPGG